MKKLLVYLFLLLALSLFPLSSFGDEIKVGWIGPLTGNAAILGVDSAEAIQMVFDQINNDGGVHGRKLRLIVEDDQYLTSKTVSAYNKLVHQERVKILFVLTYGGLFAIADRAKRDGVLIVDTLDCDAKIAALPSNVLCISKRTEELGELIAQAAIDREHAPVAMIYFNGDPFMGTLAESSKRRFEDAGIKVVLSEGYADGTSDFKTLVTKVKKSGAKSVFFYGYDKLGTAMRDGRSLGLTIPYYGVNTITSPGFQEAAGSSVNGTLVGTWLAPRTPAFKDFVRLFKERKGRDPLFEVSTVPSYDVAKILAKSFEQQKEEVTAEQTQRYIYSLKDYKALSGSISMNPDGAASGFRNSIYKFENGNLLDPDS